jgi:hypothetical protein
LTLVLALEAPASSPRVELYTMGQGPILFERYGHAALCVVDDGPPRRTRCYNYGTTDFSSGALAIGWEFLQGTSRFWVSTRPLEPMLSAYLRSDRTLYRQVLPLSPEQVGELAARLEHDALEENKYYIYHHFFDNCTTRLRDHIDAVSGGALSRAADAPGPLSFRELGRRGIAELTPAIVAGTLFVGRGADAHPTEYELMFLPDYLRLGVAERLGAEPELLYERRGPPLPQDGSRGTLWFVLAAVAIALPAWLSWLTGRRSGLAFGVSGALVGLLAVAVWGLAVLSSVREFRVNEALLVFLPSDLALGLLSGSRRLRYARWRLVGLFAVSIGLALGVLVQPLIAPLLIPVAVFAAVVVPRRRPRECADGARQPGSRMQPGSTGS